MGLFSFVFQSSVAEIDNQQYLANCPFPTFSAKPELDPIEPIEGINVVYTLNHSSIFVNDLFTFDCSVDSITGLKGVSVTFYNSTTGSFFEDFNNAFAWTGYVYAGATAFGQKIQHTVIALWLMYDAPAQVTGLVWWTYVNIILTAFIGIGGYMLVRRG